MNYFLHYITIVPKIIIITLVANFHKALLWLAASSVTAGVTPNLDRIRVEYRAVKLTVYRELVVLPDGTAILNTNPDHQALRQGSLAWSNPRPDVINGLANYIRDGQFIRGYLNNDLNHPNLTPAPSAMPMSVAFGLVAGMRAGVAPNPSVVEKYLQAVDNLMAKDMEIDTSVSVKPRLESTGYDAAYALSLLYTASYLRRSYGADANGLPDKYLAYANEILFKRGYAALLLAPMTWTTSSHRDSFKDHLAIVGLWTAYQTCPNAAIRLLLRHALKFVNSQSYAYTNPYWSALAYEVGALPESERRKILAVHWNSSILKAAKVRAVSYNNTMPSDYSTHTADEFMFDELRGKGVDLGGEVIKYVSLNGLCLGKSLAVLLNGNL